MHMNMESCGRSSTETLGIQKIPSEYTSEYHLGMILVSEFFIQGLPQSARCCEKSIK